MPGHSPSTLISATCPTLPSRPDWAPLLLCPLDWGGDRLLSLVQKVVQGPIEGNKVRPNLTRLLARGVGWGVLFLKALRVQWGLEAPSGQVLRTGSLEHQGDIVPSRKGTVGPSGVDKNFLLFLSQHMDIAI